VSNLERSCGPHAHFVPKEQLRAGKTVFGVKHYAGDVAYDCRNFIDKNRDTLYQDLVDVVLDAGNGVAKTLFLDRRATPGDKGQRAPPTISKQYRQNRVSLLRSSRWSSSVSLVVERLSPLAADGLERVQRVPAELRHPENHVSVKAMGKKSRKPKKAAVAERPQVLETDAVPASPPSPATSKICVVCGQEGLKKCEGCRSTRYCDTDCQTRHWPRHKDFCAAVALVGEAKAELACCKRNATDFVNLCVEAASAINTGDCSASSTADFRIKAILSVNRINENLTRIVRVMANAVVRAAVRAESPKAAAAIARSAAKQAFASILERRGDIVGTPCENAFDTPQHRDASETAFQDAFAVIERLNLTDEESDNISAAVNAVFTVVRDQANAEVERLDVEIADPESWRRLARG
jgi:hypothetical protein